MLLKEMFNRGPKLYPNKVAIIDGDRSFTFGEAGERWNRLANALIDKGLKKGDKLGFLLLNCTEIVDAMAAAAKAGLVCGGVNYRLAPEGMKKVLTDMQCRALLVGADYVEIINSLRPELPFIETYISVGTEAPGMVEYESLIKDASPVEPKVETDRDDPVYIIYTSGTTGEPKGAIATRQTVVHRLVSNALGFEMSEKDKFIQVFPLFHVGNHVTMAFLSRAATVTIMREWDVKKYCETVQEQKINKINLAPVMINFLVNWPEATQYDFSSVELMQYGASPTPLETLRKAVKLLPNCRFLQAYGSSETFIPVYLTPEDHERGLSGEKPKILGACGRQGPLSMARVVNEKGEDVKPGEIGEIILGGGQIMSGYLNKPKETAEALKDGWMYTKDLATVDEEGYMYIVDRKNYMIITGGENVYPAQVENVLFDHPKIVDATVLGVPDEKWGEAVKAIVVVKEGETLTEEEVIEFCKPRMANYAKPKSVDFVDSLPLTATGKVNKVLLKKKYWGDNN